MTGRHAAPVFDILPAEDDGAHRWPFIITAEGEPVARVTDRDTAEAAVEVAKQVTAEGWPPGHAVVRALQDSLTTGAEGVSADRGAGWLAWSDWLDIERR